MRLAHVVAVSENGVIGSQGNLPWYLPEDLKRFKRLTLGHILIMGRKTYESIGRALPGRYTIVVSRHEITLPHDVSLVHSIDDAFALAHSLKQSWGEEVFVVGGGEIYLETLAFVEKIHLTRVHRVSDGDTFYPEPDSGKFRRHEQERVTHCDPSFTVYTYERLS